MNRLLSFIFITFLMLFGGCEQGEMPNIGGDTFGPTELVGCEGANVYDWDSIEFQTSLDQYETVWIAFDLTETTLFNVFVDQAGFHCVIFNGCNGELGSGPPEYDFETIGNGQEVGILTDGQYYMEITNTRNRVDFTFSITLNNILYGCINNDALNYNPDANVDDGSCQFIDCNIPFYTDNYGEMVNDCDGNCAPLSWVGDFWCDDLVWCINNPDDECIGVNLMCEEFDWDGGDCDIIEEGCLPGFIEDCNDNCVPEVWVGDDSCDDGSFTFDGNQIFFNCEEFNNDNGDCDESLNRQIQQPKYPNGRIQLGQ